MKIQFLKFTAFTFLSFFVFVSQAQSDKSTRPSPPDQVSSTIEGVNIVIDYSQPSLKGRDINTLAPVGEVWRTGANEASWISVSEDVKI